MIDSASGHGSGQSGCVPFCARSGTEWDGHSLGHNSDRLGSNTWGFVSPFQTDLWVTILLTALAVGLFQGVANLATKDIDDEGDALTDSDEDKETGFWEAVWQSFVALVQLGPEFLPRSLSERSTLKQGAPGSIPGRSTGSEHAHRRCALGKGTLQYRPSNRGTSLQRNGSCLQLADESSTRRAGRVSAFFWGIGILVAISTYTANLAAFLTVRNVDNSISSAEDLLKQTTVSYGVIRPYATWVRFKTATSEPQRSLGMVMQAHKDSVLAENLAEGLDKIRQGNYVLFADNAEVDYHASREPCDIQTIGRLFWQTGYGIFLPKNSKYTVEFNKAIVKAKERSVNDELDAKWIKSQECTGKQKSVLQSSVIGLQDMLGVFVLVYGGMALGLVLMIGEFFYTCAQDVKKADAQDPAELFA
ncbi:Glutamate receptor 1 [Branchiostoma belcheri]|nr:Glutamate receptor 1 [Branchiostoma belcheri]